ncbi:MAG: sigma 54-interacting transcriptional regulator [Deltaproteobacteria bacterium]|nr:sigma 54-interacting transcriptional regulator [Deltaproteobacteria bacterium]
MDDQFAPAFRNAELESIKTPSPRFKSNQPLDRSTLIGDWNFESNRNFQSAAPINRLVGESRTMMSLRARVIRYAETEETVLIFGETGTGKELIARLLHDLSPRRRSPFVAVNCAAIPGALAESELFGSTRGAYTGAVQCRSGLISRANGGTLFLDEFGELATEVQSKLLRALELGAYRPLGANREERADARIIAATNRDLERSVLRGEFRADLYYRINVLQIVAPPLRKHRGDIPQIAGKILGELLPTGAKIRVTESVMAELLQAPWPGNVRELKNVLRRSLVMSSGGVIDRLECDLHSSEPNLVAARNQCAPVGRLIDILTRNKGHLEAVAHELNVSVRTVQRRIKKSGLRLRDFRGI